MNDWAHQSLCVVLLHNARARDGQIRFYLHTYLPTVPRRILVVSCRGQYNREMWRTRLNLWSVRLLDRNLRHPRLRGVLWTVRAVLIIAWNRASDPHPPSPTPIIPITATFSVMCKVVQNVSQPARKRGQGCVLTVSSGSIKRYCVCRQLLTVHFVSMWGGQLWRAKRRGKGGGESSDAWHMFLSFWFPLRSLA